MKTAFSIFFILLCSSVLAQAGDTSGKNEFFGYFHGTRLDSIHAHYAIVYLRDEVTKKPNENGIDSTYVDPQKLCFSFQVEESQQDEYIRDSQGNTISFSGNIAATLNFLYFNGWELVKVLADDPAIPYSTVPGDVFLLKKKDPNSSSVLQ